MELGKMVGNVANIDPYGSSAAREHPEHYDRPETLTIDIHGHIRTDGVDEEVRKFVPAMSLDSIKYASPLTRDLNKKQGADRNEELEFESLTGAHYSWRDTKQVDVGLSVCASSLHHGCLSARVKEW